MRLRLRGAMSVALALATALNMSACASKKQEEAGTTTPTQAAVSDAATVEYEGTLLTAYDQKMVVSGADGDMEFVTNDHTRYHTGTEGEMYLDDIISVVYHVENNVNYADEIVLVEHMDTAVEFAGELVQADKHFITLIDKNLSVTFQIDEDTYIVGDLSQGDKIELTYLGDLSEYPYANVVAVVEEVEPPKTATIHGVVSELTNGSVLVGIDSAHSYRFGVTNSTKIAGAADHLTIGDQVDVTFEGKVDAQPNALTIAVTKLAQKRAYIINGSIESVADGTVTLSTDKAKYTFSTSKTTKFYGDKPAKGYKTEITYTGDLNSKPAATIVYCVKNPEEVSKAQKAAAEKQKKAAEQHAPNEAKDDGEEAATGAKDQQAPKDESGTAEPPAADTEQESSTVDPQPAEEEESSTVDPQPIDEDEPSEEQPAEEQPVEEQPAEEEPSEEVEPTVEPGSEDETTEEPEATEPEPEPEPEATEPEATEEVEGGDEATTNVDMNVWGKGTIISGDEKKMTVEIEFKDGTKVTFTFDSDTKIASGYIPAEGDTVKIKYVSSTKLLKEIQLVKRGDEAGSAAEGEPAVETEESNEG